MFLLLDLVLPNHRYILRGILDVVFKTACKHLKLEIDGHSKAFVLTSLLTKSVLDLWDTIFIHAYVQF